MAKKKLVQIAKDVDQEEEKKKKAASTSSAAEKAKQTLAQAVKSAIQAEATKQASAPARSVTVPTGNKYTLPSVSTAGPMTAAQQQANGAFNNYFNELLKDFNTYASYGPQQRQELAKGLSSGAIAAPNKGDINNWNDEAALRMSAANAEIIKRLSDAGIFDDPYYALNSNYIGMPTLGYLEGIEEETQKKLEDSLRMDEEDRLYQSNLESTRGAWEQLEAEKNNPYTFDPMYGYAMMEYLQGDRAEPFNYDQWDYEYQMLAPDQRQARLADLEKQWNGLDFDALTGRSYKGYESQTPQLQAQADMLQKEIENRSIIEALESGAMNAADFAEMSKYAGDVLQMGVNDELMYSDPVFFVNNLFTDDFYNATHNSQINWWNRQIEHSESPYLQMGLANAADYEKAVITYYARTGNTEALQQYLNAKSGEWTKRRADTNADYWSTLAQNDKTGWIAWMMARSADVLNYDDKAMQALATLMGNADPNAAYFDEANMKAAIDAANLETLGDIEWLNGFKFGGKNLAQHAYSAGTGAVDSGLSLLLDMLYGGGGKINQALMASQAFSGGLQESAERGLSAAHSFAKSGWDAFVGYMSEKLGVGPEGLTSSSSFRKDFLSEGTEEIVGALGTDIGDELLAQMFGTTSSFEEEVNALALAGSKDPQRDAIYNRLAGYAEAFGYGGIAGGMLGAPGNIATSIDNRATGKAIMNEGDAQRLLEIAKSMDTNSDVYQIATEIEATTGKGKKMSLGKLGKLTKSLGETLGKQYADITDGVMDKAIQNRLVELGSTPEAAKQNASIIRKIVNGVKLTVTERASAKWDQFAEQVTKEISRQMNATQQNNAAVPGAAAPEGQRTGQKWVKEMHAAQIEATGEVKSKQIRLYNALTTKQSVSTTVQEAVKNSAGKVRKGKSGKAAGKVNATKVYYDDGTVRGEGDIQRFEESEGGKLLMVIEGKDGEAKVDIGSFTQADGEGTAGLLESIKDINDNLHKVSAEEASAMLSSYKAAGGDVARFVEGYETLYLRGYSGGTDLAESLPKTDLDGTLANIAVEAGKRQAEADETARKQRASAYKAVEAPTSGWLGKVTSDAQVRGSGDAESLTGALDAMTESQRMTAETAIELGKAIGVNVVLYESDSKNMGRIANGSFDQSTHTVYLDINAGLGSAQDIQAQKDNGTLGYAIMRTMGHELTHYLEAASPEMYAKYKTAVTNALKDAGQDMAVLIREKIDRALAQGKKLSYNGAVAEVIADASEYMLQDSKFTTRLDNTLRGKVKNFVQNFMGKVKEIFSNLTSAHRESAALREMVDGVHRYTGQLQELWDASLQEVMDKGTVGQAEANADAAAQEGTPVEDLQPVRQFSMGRDVEVREDGLIAMHNLKESDVYGTLGLGGFPMPSIAIVKAKHGHSMYGEYSVIFGKETIDPKADVKNRVYGADAWTPVFPHVETEVLDDVLWDVQQEAADLAGKVDEEYGRKARTWFGNFSGSDTTTKTMDDIVESAANNTGMMAAYLIDKGETVEVLEKDVQVERGYNPAKADQYDQLLDIIDMNDYFNMPMHEFLDTYGDRFVEVSGQMARLNAHWKTGDRRSGAAMARIIKEAIEYEGAGRDTSVQTKKAKDFYATDDAIRARVDRKDFSAWAREKLQPAFGEQGIYNGKDRFTPSGNRRSFKQTHNPLTASNVVKSMLTQEESAIPVTDAKGLMAAAASMYKSIAEIKGDASRLGKISEEEYNARIAAADNAFHDFLNAIEAWDYDEIQNAGALLVQAAKKRMDASAISALFKKNGFPKATVKAAILAENVIKQVQTIPTGYFEAKPARVVGFDEVKMLVAPDTMPQDLANKLDEAGIPYTTYDGTEADRLAKVNAVQDVRFSMREGPVTDDEVIRALKWCAQLTARNDKSYDWNYVPVRATTPNYILVDLEEDDVPMVMNVHKTRQALTKEGKTFGESVGHGYTPREMADLFKKIDQPEYFAYSVKRGNYGVVVEHQGSGVVFIIAPPSNMNADLLMSEHGGRRTVAVTVFHKVNVEDAIFYLENGGYKERPVSAEAKGNHVPELTKESVYHSVPQSDENVNPERKFSTRDLPTDITVRDYLRELKPTDRMNETEKILLKRYQDTLGKLQEAEKKATEQNEILKTATGDELIKAKNRWQIYRKQADRYARELARAERAEGFAGMLATGQKLVDQYLTGGYTRIADASDELEAEIKGIEKKLKVIGATLQGAEQGQKNAHARGLFNQSELNVAKDLAQDILTSSKYKRGIAPFVKMAEGASDLSSYVSNAEAYGGQIANAAAKAVEGAIQSAKTATKKASSLWHRAVKEVQLSEDVIDYYRALDEQRRLMELAEQKKALSEQLKTDAAKKIHEQVEKAREEMKERQQDLNAMRALREKNEKTKKRIKTVVKRLDNLIRNETDQKHVPEGFKPVVEEMVRLFINDESIEVFGSIDTEQGQRAVAKAYVAYEQLRNMDGEDVNQMSEFYDAEMEDTLKDLSLLLTKLNAESNLVGTERLRTQAVFLEGIEEIVSNINHISQNIGEIILNDKKASLASITSSLRTQLEEKPNYRELAGAGQTVQGAAQATKYGNMTPVYFFRELGLDKLTELADDLFAAEDKYGILFAKAQNDIRNIVNRHNYWAWINDEDLTFKTKQGIETKKENQHTITMSKSEAMVIWATWKREHQGDALIQTNHISNGGVVFGKRQNGIWVETDTTAHKLSELDMRTIDQYLTDEQKAFADEFVDFLTQLGQTLGNETSMELYGFKKFKDGYYFPITVDRGQLAQKSDAGHGATDDSRIKHMPSSRKRINNASNALVIGDFLDIGTRHVQQMLTYHCYAVPVENMNRVLNAAYNDDSDSRTTIRKMIGQKYGEEAISYLERFIADMNGGVKSDKVEKGFGKLVSLFKKSAVVNSLSVAIQQPTSIIRAMMEINPKYFVPFVGRDANTQLAKEWEQLKKHSGVAVLKEIGGFDMTKSGGMAQTLAGNMEDGFSNFQMMKLAFTIGAPKGQKIRNAGRQWDKAFGFLASKADQAAWAYMWRVVKAETHALHPEMDVNSDEFLNLAGDRFNEVMRLTQVYDSTMARSQNMRSDSQFMKMLTAFGAEGTLTANMLYDAIRSKNGKTISKAFGLFFASQIVTAAFSSLIKAGRDDDEEKTWAEKYLAAMGNALGGWSGALNPLALLPVVRDIMSLLDGYDIERSDMTIAADLVKEAEKLMNGKYADDPWKGVENVGGIVANAFGIPLKNMMRDARSLWNTATGLLAPPRKSNAMVMTKDALDNFSLNLLWEPDTSVNAYYAKLYEATLKKDAQLQEDLKEYLGILGKDEADIKNGIVKVVKAKYLDGDLTDAEAQKILLENGWAKDQKDAFSKVDEWKEMAENGDVDDYSHSVYNTVYEAIDSGNSDAAKAAIKELTSNGWEQDDVESKIRTHVRKSYMSGTINQSKVKELYKQYCMPSNFDPDDENDWFWLFQELDYGKKNGGSAEGWTKYGDWYKAIESGTDLKKTAQFYMEHGVEKSTLSSQITSQYKQQLIDLKKSGKGYADLQARLLTAYEALGYDRNKKLKDIQKWFETK